MEILDGVTLQTADCLDAMPTLPNGSVGMVLTDLPYGTTYAPWDSVIPLDRLWSEWRRLLRPNGVVVMTASQPFTSVCVMSNLKEFRCEWVWDKTYPTNFPNAKKQPLKIHESVLVFSEELAFYNPLMVEGELNHAQGKGTLRHESELRQGMARTIDDQSGMKYPKSILTFPKHSSSAKWHSSQKPVELFEYLIRTYSKEGELVLDCCAGSGTTGIAAYQANRRSLLIEKDPKAAASITDRFRTPGEVGDRRTDNDFRETVLEADVSAWTKARRQSLREKISDRESSKNLFDVLMGMPDE